jgi:adiponectin receptor
MVHRSKDAMVHSVQNASEMVHRSKDVMVQNASDMVHNASDMVHRSKDAAEELAKDMYERLRHWKACHHEKLPSWMKDNEHLHFGHRPELPSALECFRSIFRIHTETGNIWTHLIGFVTFVILTIIFYIQPLCATCKLDINLSEKLIFLCFFIGAIVCLGCSALFHTMSCHSPSVSAIFSRLDYAGIAILIVGSIIPWLYYGFYCQFYFKMTYIIAVSIFGILTIILTLMEQFNRPEYRTFRAITFVGLALLSSTPVIHYMIVKGFYSSIMEVSMQCTLIMGALYLTGAILYAARIPERFIPGKCDIWFQSHQIFHVLVIVAAFVHYQGISEMAMARLKNDSQCLDYIEAPNKDPLLLTNIDSGSVY